MVATAGLLLVKVMGTLFTVEVAVGVKSTCVNVFDPGAVKLRVGAVTVNVCGTSGGRPLTPVVPPPCDAVITDVPRLTKCILPFTMVATAGLLLVKVIGIAAVLVLVAVSGRSTLVNTFVPGDAKVITGAKSALVVALLLVVGLLMFAFTD